MRSLLLSRPILSAASSMSEIISSLNLTGMFRVFFMLLSYSRSPQNKNLFLIALCVEMLHNSGMQSRNIPIRFDTETIMSIDSAAKELGLHRSGLIKMAVRIQVRQILDGVLEISARGLSKGAKTR